jgi:hypothetical protein
LRHGTGLPSWTGFMRRSPEPAEFMAFSRSLPSVEFDVLVGQMGPAQDLRDIGEDPGAQAPKELRQADPP